MAELVFWVSFGGLFATYVGYPALMALVARLPERAGAKPASEADQPPVTIVIAAKDEQGVISLKLESCLAQRYPAERLDVLVVSDGSTDGTVEAVTRLGSSRVRLLHLDDPAGKAGALNAALSRVEAPVVVLTDARQPLHPDATALLVNRFGDPKIGGVSGDLRYDRENEAGLRKALHAYWDYEKSIRLGESRIHSCVGATGALYAIRRSLWRDLPGNTLLDDVYTPMQIVLAGYRVVFEPLAWASDEASEADDREYLRRVRTLTGNYQLLLYLPGVLNPLRNPIWWQFALHKLGRLFSPLMLAGLLLGSLLAGGALYQVAYWAQWGFWAFAFFTYVSRSRLRFARPLALPYAFAMTQGAAVVAFLHFLRRDWNVWSR